MPMVVLVSRSTGSFADRLGSIAAELGFQATLVNKGTDTYTSTAASETPSASALEFV